MINKLLFVFHKPKVFNIGDFLCTPQHYFDFGMQTFNNSNLLKNSEFNCIIGGGAYTRYAENLVGKINANKIASWGIGDSKDISEENYNVAIDKFIMFSTRDISLKNKNIRFVPCVSVFNSIVDIPAPDSGKLGILLNYDSDITSSKSIDEVRRFCCDNNCIFGTNSLSQTKLKLLMAQVDKVITNSYHLAYWSLLSGREVCLLGYSSKFLELYKMFELKADKIYKYSRKQKDSIIDVVKSAYKADLFSKLYNPQDFKNEFRKININFANELQNIGIVRNVKVIKQTIFSERYRDVMYRAYLRLKLLKNSLKGEI